MAFFVYNIVELGAWTAILIYAYEATGPVSVGIVAVLQLLPSAAIAPLLAGIADRFRRSRVLVGWYLAQAAAVGAVGFAILLGLPPFLVYGISTLATIALTQTRPVQGALLPELADTPAELTASNALAIIGEGVGAMVGPLAVGILLMVAPIGTAFVACGLLLVGAGLLLLGLHRHDAAIEAPAEPAAAKSGEAADPFAGLREVARDRDLVVVMALLTGRLVIYGGLEVLIVLLAIELLGVGDSGAGFLMAPLGMS